MGPLRVVFFALFWAVPHPWGTRVLWLGVVLGESALRYLDEMVAQTPNGIVPVFVTNREITPGFAAELSDRGIVSD